jgi:hypothetical protein
MASRPELDALLRQLERDMPYRKVNVDGFYQEFDRTEMIVGAAEGSEAGYVLDCLMTMLRRAGISQRLEFKKPTMH